MDEKKTAVARRIQAKDLRCEKRQPLQDLIPLPAPFVVYVDPTNLCNFRCRFCPTADHALMRQIKRAPATMGLDLFRKVIDDLKALGVRLKLLSLYKDGEPLVNRDFAEMVRYAKQAGVAERIWTKTNGALLNPELSQRIVEAGLDMICVSVEGVSSEAYQRISDVKLDYEAFVGNVRALFERRGQCEVYVKIADSGLSRAEVDQFYRDFEPYATHIAVEKLMGWSNSGVKDFTLGTKPDTYDGLPFTPKDVCAYPFYCLAVNAEGSVVVCANDWSYATVVGDAKTQSIREIWEGEALHQFRRMMLEKRRCENAACADCFYLQIVPDNLDPYREALLARLAKSRRGHE
ncbi:MAG: radical SAM/SPASM domain-containing protein [Myxococcales bacterium]